MVSGKSGLSWGQIAQHCWFNILLISASLNKNKEVVGNNNDFEPMLTNLTPALVGQGHFLVLGLLQKSLLNQL